MVAAVIGFLMILAAGIQFIWRRNFEDLKDFMSGIFKFVVIWFAGATIVVALWEASDAITNAILGEDYVDTTMNPLFTAAWTPTASAALLILAILGLITGVLLFFAMLFRIIGILVLTFMLPIVAAGQLGGPGRQWLPKVMGTLIALIFFRPLAALMTWMGVRVMSSVEGGENGVMPILVGISFMIAIVIALPALMKLVNWTTASTAGAGGMGGSLLGAAAGGMMVSRMIGGGAQQQASEVAASDGPSPGGGSGAGGGGPAPVPTPDPPDDDSPGGGGGGSGGGGAPVVDLTSGGGGGAEPAATVPAGGPSAGGAEASAAGASSSSAAAGSSAGAGAAAAGPVGIAVMAGQQTIQQVKGTIQSGAEEASG